MNKFENKIARSHRNFSDINSLPRRVLSKERRALRCTAEHLNGSDVQPKGGWHLADFVRFTVYSVQSITCTSTVSSTLMKFELPSLQYSFSAKRMQRFAFEANLHTQRCILLADRLYFFSAYKKSYIGLLLN